MSMKKFKLLKDLPDVKAGAIFELIFGGVQGNKYINYEYDVYYNTNIVENNPEWFEEIIEPTFNIGDIVVTANYSITTKIIDKFVDGNKNIGYLVESNPANYYEKDLRLATEKEIIQYYESKGWVKGSKFKYAHTYDKILTIKNIFIRNNKVCIQQLETDINGLSNDDFSVLFIENCKLLKKPEYPKSWEELEKVKGWYIDEYSNINEQFMLCNTVLSSKNMFATKKQAESTIAFAQLSQLHKKMIEIYNAENNCDWKANYNDYNQKYIIDRYKNNLVIKPNTFIYYSLVFPTRRLAEFSLEHHKKLWEQYYELLHKRTRI